MCVPSSSLLKCLGRRVIIPSFTACSRQHPPTAKPIGNGGCKIPTRSSRGIFLDWKVPAEKYEIPHVWKKNMETIAWKSWEKLFLFFWMTWFLLISQSNLYHVGVFVMSNHTRFSYHEEQFSLVGCSPSSVERHYVSFVDSHAFHGPHGLQGCSCLSSTGAPKEPKQGGPSAEEINKKQQADREDTYLQQI